MSIRLPNGKIKYILSVTSAFTESDATEVGATLIKHHPGQGAAIVASSDPNLPAKVDGGQLKENILFAMEDVGLISVRRKRLDQGIAQAKKNKGSSSHAYHGQGPGTYGSFGPRTLNGRDQHSINGCWQDILHNMVKLNPNAAHPERPYLPPTRDTALTLTGTFTWSSPGGVPTCTVTVAMEKDSLPLQFYRGCKMKKNGDNQVDPWFIAKTCVRNSAGNYTLTFLNREGRTFPSGAGASSMLLQGSGVTVGLIGAGLPLVLGNTQLSGMGDIGTHDEAHYLAEFHPHGRLWNKDKAYVGNSETARDVVANRRAPWDHSTVLSAGESAKLGGWLGVNVAGGDREKFVFDWESHSAPNMGFSEQGDPIPCPQLDAQVCDVDWTNMVDADTSDPVTGPVTVLPDAMNARRLKLTVQDTSQFRRLPLSVEEATAYGLSTKMCTGPVDMVGLDKAPYQVTGADTSTGGFFQILEIDDTNKTITILVKPGCTTPTQSGASDTSSFVQCGRTFGMIPHAKIVSYRATEPEDGTWLIATLGTLMTTLERSDADGVDVLHFEASEIGLPEILYGTTSVPWGKARAHLRKTLIRLAAKGVFLFCGPSVSGHGTNLDQECKGKDTSYPGDNPNVICCGSCCPKDFDPLDTELSGYMPDPNKPVQSRLKNLARPMLHGNWMQVIIPPTWGYIPPNFIYPYDFVSFGSIIDIAAGSGGSDQRYLDVYMDANTYLASCGVRGTWTGAAPGDWDTISDPRLQWGPPEIGLRFNIGFSSDGAFILVGGFTLGLEAYIKTHSGNKPTGNALIQKLYKSAWKNIGPATDDVLFMQPNVLDNPPPTKFFYPKTKYQTIILADYWENPTPMAAWSADGEEVQGEIFYEDDFYGQTVHDTNFDWSRHGKTKGMGQGVLNVKAFLVEAIK